MEQNEAVMHMMKEIKKPDRAKVWIENALAKKKYYDLVTEFIESRLESSNNETLHV